MGVSGGLAVHLMEMDRYATSRLGRPPEGYSWTYTGEGPLNTTRNQQDFDRLDRGNWALTPNRKRSNPFGMVGRVALGVATGGMSEVAMVAGQRTGIDPRLINPVAGALDAAGQKAGLPPTMTPTPQAEAAVSLGGPAAPPDPRVAARQAQFRRRRMYADAGRSGTILTGSDGLGMLGTGQGKTLLGM